MTAPELRGMALESADLSRVTRYYALALFVTDRTGLARAAAEVAVELADRYSCAALNLDHAARELTRGAP
jgi:hypothetical protein